jgi:RHS repeat-associated protein
VVSGETITYQYDTLNRLASAAGSGGGFSAWSDAYSYDGFGNLLSKSQTGGAPQLSQGVNPVNNQLVEQTYDLNGNQLTAPGVTTGLLTYDAENRVTAAPGIQYAYDSGNKRVWSATLDSSGNMTSQTAYVYGGNGKKLASYALTVSGTAIYDPPAETDVYFAGRRVYLNGAVFSEDRLGSNASVSLYPWGEDQGTPAPNDQVKFATYTRDSATLLDYANNRYYVNNQGRFMSPDPAGQAAVNPRNPVSWNRYAYAGGDPVNRNDPTGLLEEGDGPAVNPFSSSLCYPNYDPVWGGYYGCGSAPVPVQVPTKPPPSGTNFAGFREAVADLDKAGCAGLISGTSGLTARQLADDLGNAQVTAGTSQPGNTPVTFTQNPDGTYTFNYQWGYTSNGDIQLNGNYFPNPTQQNINLPGGGTTSLLNIVNMALGSNLDATQFGTLVFLHELSHIANGNTNIDSNAYNGDIISTCLN